MDAIPKGREKTTLGYCLLILYILIEYVRPEYYIGFLSQLRLKTLIIVIAVLYLFYYRKQIKFPVHMNLYVIFLMLVWGGLLYSTNQFWLLEVAMGMLYYGVFILLFVYEVVNIDKFRHFIFFFIVANTITAAFSIMNGGVGPSGFLSDENDIAIAMTIVFPLAIYAFVFEKRSLIKLFYCFTAILLAIAVIASQSRGGAVAFFAMVLIIILLSKKRVRNLFFIMIVASLIFLSLPSEYKGELRSISDTSDSTRLGRFHTWSLGWDMFLDNPLLGVGAMNYPWRVAEYENPLAIDEGRRSVGGRVSHSLYFTLLPELGLLGAVIYITLLIKMLLGLYRCWKYGVNAEVRHLAGALLASIISYHVGAIFLSILYYPHYWYMLAFSMVVISFKERFKDSEGHRSIE